MNSRKDAFALCFDEDEVTVPKITYGRESDPLSQARELFEALRLLDERGAKKVYAHSPSLDGVGMAVYNRLIRAAAFRVIDLNKPFLFGLTGQTGAGKGYVGELLKDKGFTVIDADFYSRKITEKNSPIFPALTAQFGEDIIENGFLNRALLAKRAFESREKTDALNSILHPAIMEMCKNAAQGLSVLDAPQLFEAGGKEECYKVIGVTAPQSVRLERIMKRDKISEEQALLRINAQHSEEYYTSQCDYIINNDGSADVLNQLNNILEDTL